MDHTSETTVVSAEVVTLAETPVAPPASLSADRINKIIADKDWASLEEALELGQIEVIPSALSKLIQQRNRDFSLFLKVQRDLFLVLYPLMKNPDLLKAYLSQKDGKTVLKTNQISKELLGVELKATNIVKLMPLLMELKSSGKDGIQKLYNESVLKGKISKMYTVGHLKEDSFKEDLPEYLQLALRYDMIPKEVLNALVQIDLLSEAQKNAILSPLNKQNDGE